MTGQDLSIRARSGRWLRPGLLSEIVKLMSATDYRFHLYFWRTQAGHEVDSPGVAGKLAAIEVKWSLQIDEATVSSLKRCHEDLKGKLQMSVILYGGTEVVPLTPKIIAIPYSVFFGHLRRRGRPRKKSLD